MSGPSSRQGLPDTSQNWSASWVLRRFLPLSLKNGPVARIDPQPLDEIVRQSGQAGLAAELLEQRVVGRGLDGRGRRLCQSGGGGDQK